MKRAEWTPGRGQVQTTYLIIYENEKVNNVRQNRWRLVTFVKPYTKFILNKEFFRKVVLVKLRINEISQCRRSHQWIDHVQKPRSRCSGQSSSFTH